MVSGEGWSERSSQDSPGNPRTVPVGSNTGCTGARRSASAATLPPDWAAPTSELRELNVRYQYARRWSSTAAASHLTSMVLMS